MLSSLSTNMGISFALILLGTWPTSTEKPGSTSNHSNRPKIEVCFVLDTTGSMGGLIQAAKDKIWSIANELVSSKPAPEIRFSLIGYRDRGDTYVTQLTDLTDDIDAIHAKLMGFNANGGGDGPESVNLALLESVTKIDWTTNDPKVLKIVFLVGDAPPHMDYQDETKYPEICQMALKNDLIINTIQCGTDSNTTMVWKEIARKSEGSFAAIEQNGGAVAIVTPFDKEIAKCNSQINATVCGYGDLKVQKDVMSKIASNEQSKTEAIADRALYFSKSRKLPSPGTGGGRFKAIGGQNDLVELLIDGEIDLADVDASKLPIALQELSLEQRENELNKRIQERKKSQSKMDELVHKRSEFIQKKRQQLAKSGKVDSFDLKVKEMIRSQAKSKGIDYDK